MTEIASDFVTTAIGPQRQRGDDAGPRTDGPAQAGGGGNAGQARRVDHRAASDSVSGNSKRKVQKLLALTCDFAF